MSVGSAARPCCFERLEVRVVPFADVPLAEIADESDPRVSVLDEVLDGGEGALMVVRADHRRLEVLHLGARQEHDGLSRVANPLQVLLARRRRDRHDAVHLRPRHRGGEVPLFTRLVSGRELLARLDDDEAPVRLDDLPGETGEDIPEEVPSEARSQHERGRCMDHRWPISVTGAIRTTAHLTMPWKRLLCRLLARTLTPPSAASTRAARSCTEPSPCTRPTTRRTSRGRPCRRRPGA